MAVSYLASHFGREFFELDIPFVRQLNQQKADFLLRMMEQGLIHRSPPVAAGCSMR